MEAESSEVNPGKHPFKTRRALKLGFVLILAGAAGLAGYFQLFRTHPAQSTVARVFDLVEADNLEGVWDYVDPGGQLGIIWHQNREGARDAIISIMERFRVEFEALKFSTQSEGDVAEVELRGGRIAIYAKDGSGSPAASFDLAPLDIVFYLEKREGDWFIEGINYDVLELLRGGQAFF